MTAGVLFDLDDTLLDRQMSIRGYAQRLFHAFAAHLPCTGDEFIARFVALDGNGYVDRETFFAALAEALSTPAFDHRTIAVHFAEHAWERPVVTAGAPEACRRLRQAGVPVAVVTNGGSRNQRAKLRNSGLDELVDAVLISEEFGAKKPDPSIFLEACRQIGAEPGQSWFVGDHPEFDMAGATAAGLHAVWLQRALPWPEEVRRCYTYHASTLTQVVALILAHSGNRLR